MPTRIVVHLGHRNGRAPVPRHTGPAINAAFLAQLREAGEAGLTSALHETRPPKPYTLTPLLGPGADGSSGNARFEVALLADALVAPVLQALAKTRTLRVANCFYEVASVEVAATEQYATLVARARPTDGWRLRIRTPMAFLTAREEGARRCRPFPEAEWVFSNLHRRWEFFAPEIALPPSAAAAITSNLEVADHRLTMAEHLLKPGAPPGRGSVGEVVYRLAEARRVPSSAKIALDALVRFSRYAGIGDRTTIGMGNVHPVPANPRVSSREGLSAPGIWERGS